jgi:hypothetical protein
MHLPSNDHSGRFGGVSEKTLKKELPTDGISEVCRNGDHIEAPTQQTEQASKSNEVSIPFPHNRTRDEVLDIVFTAWTILIQRYQRDVFHQFTWGVKDADNDSSQCIPTKELDLSNQTTVGGLRQKVGSVLSRSIAVDQDAQIFLNDGTKAEVCTSEDILQVTLLRHDSGPLRLQSSSKTAFCTRLRDGFLRTCLDTKQCHNFTSLLLSLIPSLATLTVIFPVFFPSHRTSWKNSGLGTHQCSQTFEFAITK